MNEPEVHAFAKSERPRLIRYVRSLVRDSVELDAEDVVHDVLTGMFERGDQPAPEFLAAYVYRALKNRVIDYLRTRRSTVSLDAGPDDGARRLVDVLHDTRPDALESLQSEEGRTALFAALETLSDMERQVIIAHELEGVPFKELAVQLDVPQNTLFSHKSRGLKKLQAVLGSKGDI